MTQFAIPSAALGIANGTDALWFTFNKNLGQVGRITPAGRVRVYKVPGGYSTTGGIVYGPQGALWYGASNGCGPFCHKNAVIRMTVTGKATVFPINPLDFSQWLTPGPDGAVWYTAATATRGGFGRTSLDGKHTFYSDSYDAFGGAPEDITVGPDKQLWFTDWTNTNLGVNLHDAIGRLTTSGQIAARYSLPTVNSRPAMIVSGPDGNLWFTEEAANKIGRSTISGSITEFSLNNNAGPWGMTVAPDGWIWFTEFHANKVAEFKP